MPPQQDEPASNADDRGYRIMLAVVIGLGIALVVCFFIVVGTIIYSLFVTGLPDRSSELVEQSLDLDEGARIVQIDAADDRLFVLIESEGQRAIHVLDARRLTVEAIISP